MKRIKKISEAWRKNAGIRFKLPAFIILIVLSSSTAFSVLFISARKNAVIRAADEKIFIAAHSARAILGDRYHDRIIDRNSVPQREFRLIVQAFDALCRDTGLQYIWSLMILDGRIVFTSATHSDLADKNSPCASFLESHTNPGAYRGAFASMRPEYSTFHDKWGAGRMVLIPGLDGRQRKFLFAASVRLDELDAVVHRAVLQSIAVCLSIAIVMSILSLIMARSIAMPIIRLTRAAGRIAEGGHMDTDLSAGGFHEIRLLASALEFMRRAVDGQMEVLGRQKTFLQLLMDTIPDPVFYKDASGLYIGCNSAFEKFIGHTRDGIIGKSAYDVSPAELADQYTIMDQELLANPGTQRYEFKVLHSDGTTRRVMFNKATFQDERGDMGGIIGIIHDITSRVQAEEALRTSEEKFSKAFDLSRAPMAISTMDGRYIAVNREFTAVMGWSEREAIGKTATDLGLWVNPGDRQAAIDRLQASPIQRDIPVMLRTKSGELREMLFSFEKIEIGNQPCLLSLAFDVTDRKEMEEELRRNEAVLRSMFEATPAGVGFLRDRVFQKVNTSLCRITGYSEEELLGLNTRTIYPDDEEYERVGRELYGQMGREGLGILEAKHRRKDGTVYDALLYLSPFDRGNLSAGVTVTVLDITERKRAEAQREAALMALTASEERFRRLVESVTDYIYTVSIEDGRAVSTSHSPGGVMVTGYTSEEYESDPHLWYKMLHEEDREYVLEQTGMVLTGKEIPPMEHRIYHKDGSTRWVRNTQVPRLDESGRLVAYDGLIADITERKAAEESLMNAVKQLTDIIEFLPDATFIMDRDKNIIAWNRAMEEMTGVLKREIIGKDHTYSTVPFYGTRRQYLMDLVFMEDKELAANYSGISRKGDVLLAEAFTPALYNNKGAYVFAAASPLKDSGGAVIGAIESVRDITEWKQAEQNLQASLQEKEALLRELYHRTKNNMQVICSMLSLQSSHMKDEKITRAFRDMANRIHSMALVHEKLYQSRSLSSINLKEYISDLSRLLAKSYQATNGRISLHYDMEDVHMVIDSAIPCGLILNELLSNSFKYAFPDGRKGEIRIGLHRTGDSVIELKVADNGIGSPGFDIRTRGRMGIQTVLALGRQQLRGTVEFDTGTGFSCTLVFRDTIYDARV